jgi:dTDP-4-amino-4,6-dideoxygalactose transaminase
VIKVPFNKPYRFIRFPKFESTSGDGVYTKKVKQFFSSKLNHQNILLTTSCTSALEMSAILMDIKEGDEVIAPSYTFVSTVNAFVLRGARIKFIDVDKMTMNINVNLIEAAITDKTKAIIVVHYAGVPCDMDSVMYLSRKYGLFVIEDAAQALFSKYKDRYVGTIGHFGAFSFHETKNFSMGEGGALVINDPKFIDRAEVIREKGTNRKEFLNGFVDKYTWVDIGSSYLPSDILAYYLYPQLLKHKKIISTRKKIWDYYHNFFSDLNEFVEVPNLPENVEQNYHIYYIKLKDLDQRTRLIKFLKSENINAIFHYVPLHTSPAGVLYGEFIGEDRFTTIESERLLRLPLYYGLKTYQYKYICNKIKDYLINFDHLSLEV